MNSPDVTATFCATLVDEWGLLGVRHAVVSPGSRSTPMALALSGANDWQLHVFHDERSAAFAALGIATVTRVPTVLLCTSGTAAANFTPAVVEASHNEVPLLVLTADRPPELQGVGAPQTIDQKQLFGSAVRTFIDAGIPDDEQRDDWRRVARRAFNAALGERVGPVHVNLPFREPLVGVCGALPTQREVARVSSRKPVGTEVLSRLVSRCSGKRGVIVAGARGASPSKIAALAHQLNWPVLADPLGGARTSDPLAIRHADVWLRDAQIATECAPEVVLRFGTLPASKVVNAWLRDVTAETIAVGSSPFLIDPDRRVSMHVVTDADALCVDLIAMLGPCDSGWGQRWRTAESQARATLAHALDNEAVLTEPGVARTTLASLPASSRLVVSSSMPIRDVEWFGGDTSSVFVQANRGANGIDGVVSTAVGVALATGAPTGLLIGDVAFLHDSNGLIALQARKVDLRIVVIDNRGGGIFSFLPQRTALGHERFEQLFGTPHDVDLAALVAAHGVECETVGSSRELQAALGRPGPRVIVVHTNRTENVALHEALNAAVIDAVRITGER